MSLEEIQRGVKERCFVTQVTWLKFSVTRPLLHQTPSYFLEQDSCLSWPSTKFLALWTAAVFKLYRWRGIQVFGFHHAIRRSISLQRTSVNENLDRRIILTEEATNFECEVAAPYALSVAELPANTSHLSTFYTAAGLSTAHIIFDNNFRDTQIPHYALRLITIYEFSATLWHTLPFRKHRRRRALETAPFFSWLQGQHFEHSLQKLKTFLERAMKAYKGIGGTAPLILNLEAKLRWVVSFMFRQLYPRRNSPIASGEGWT
jgi:hypothetical protein